MLVCINLLKPTFILFIWFNIYYIIILKVVVILLVLNNNSFSEIFQKLKDKN